MKKAQVTFFMVSFLILSIAILSCTASPPPASQAQDVPGTPVYSQPSTGRVEDGIHIGLIRFAERSEDITNSIPVLLDRDGRASLAYDIDTRIRTTGNPGTSLLHAVHLAMANLTSVESTLPENLDSVYIITFTDGLDNQSVGLSRLAANRVEGRSFNDFEAYAAYVHREISTRRIAGVPITAFSVGIRGSDVANSDDFERHLNSIASPGNSRVLDNFDYLQNTFNEIADGLNLYSTRTNFVFTTPLLINTHIRITFDENINTSEDVRTSTRYMEGLITSTAGDSFSLTDITYGGGISTSVASGGVIPGIIDDVNLHFELNNITGYDPYVDRANTKLWRMAEGHWVLDSEIASEGSFFTTNERHSTVIYIVLDCSLSLSPRQNEDIRRAATDFVNSIYLRYYGF